MTETHGGRRNLGLIAGIAVTALLLPFLNKPLYIDDWLYLGLAERIRSAPLDPYSGQAHYLGEAVEIMRGTPHPPLWPYLLSGVLWKVPLGPHLLALALMLLTAPGIYALARRFTGEPDQATLLVMLSPAYFVTATHLSGDLSAMAFFTWALALFVRSLDEKRDGLLLASGAFLGLALLTRYSTASLIPLFLVYGFLQDRQLGRAMAAIGTGFVFLSVWFIQNVLLYGNVHILLIEGFAALQTAQSVAIRAPATGSMLGGVVGFPPFLAFLAWRRTGGARAWWIASILCTAVSLLAVHFLGALEGYTPAQVLLLAAFFLVGWGSLGAAIHKGLSLLKFQKGGMSPAHRDEIFLLLWLLLILITNVAALPMVNARYLIPLVPPLGFLLLRRTGEGRLGKAASLGVATCGLLSTAVLSILLGVVDKEAARSYPRFARDLARYRAAGNTVYYDGGRGELDHYMRLFQSGRYLRRSETSPRFGDIVVRTNLPVPLEIDDFLEARLHLEERLSTRSSIPLRLFQHQARAGFYSHHWGLLPYHVSTRPLEWIDVYRVYNVIARQRAHDRPAGEITPQRVVAQSFVGNGEPITSIKLLLATYRRRNRVSLLVQLRDEPAGRVLREKRLEPEQIQDNRWMEISFQPVQAPPGTKFHIILESPGATPGNAFTAWQSSKDVYPEGRLLVNGKGAEGDLAFVVLSGGD